MEFPDRFPDRGELILIALMESDGYQLNTRELRKSIEDLDRDQINYRISRLEQLDMVETERQGEDDTGQPRPKLVDLTSKGDDWAQDASKHLRYQIDVSDGTVDATATDPELRAEVDELREKVDALEERLYKILQQIEHNRSMSTDYYGSHTEHPAIESKQRELAKEADDEE